MKNEDILKLAERIEKIFIDTSNMILLNVIKHLKGADKVSTDEWYIKKINEVSKIEKESTAIVKKGTKGTNKDINKVLAEAVAIELSEVEKTYKKALIAKAVNDVGDIESSDNLLNLKSEVAEEVAKSLAVVKATLVNSACDDFLRIVSETIREEAQNIINQGVLKAISTGERKKILQKMVISLADKGITGFIDKAGRPWQAESYVNMLMRTNIHNTAIRSQKERAKDYNVNTFQVSSHSGARPLCAPYQGKCYSWLRGDSGVLTDLYGNRYLYESIYNTSYGQPAGLFGINCGHSPITFIDGFSVMRYEPLKTKEEEEKNAREYQNSQKQRVFERNIRKTRLTAKGLEEIQAEPELIKKYKEKAKEQVGEYKRFCEKINRYPRLDRTYIITRKESK